MLFGVAMGLSVSPATDAIMDAFPEQLLGVGGAVNDASVELGGTLDIAILGSLLSTAYRDELGSAIAGRLPADAAEVVQDSVGGALGVAQRLAVAGAQQPAADLVSVANSAFAQAVSHTDLDRGRKRLPLERSSSRHFCHPDVKPRRPPLPSKPFGSGVAELHPGMPLVVLCTWPDATSDTPFRIEGPASAFGSVPRRRRSPC
ncbi:hypothetical protein ACFRAQ_07915 [Nocardia sp. NPDC056611]|uniref:hypothetical protein n=1 Tax=Nocardia sp. NPDC056611 TaxID=3345877 RepID=UPI00366B1837